LPVTANCPICKDQEFPVVALPGLGGEPEKYEARLFYVAATRATQRLVFWGGRWVWAQVWSLSAQSRHDTYHNTSFAPLQLVRYSHRST